MKTIQKKQFISFIGFFLLALCGTIHVYGQSYHQSQLTNKEWIYRMQGKAFYFSTLFTDKEQIVYYYVNDGEKRGDEMMKDFYYLSEDIVDKFQWDSVGKSKTGKYIVSLIGGKNLEVSEILDLTDSTLKIKNVKNGKISELKAK